MTEKDSKKVSKFLSYVLRHRPESISLKLDQEGWALIDEVIKNSSSDMFLTKTLIVDVVRTSDKQRFKISDDGLKIRANQGHSINVDLKLSERAPPDVLYHGTATRFLHSIMQDGLKARSRQFVHLSIDIGTAKLVGQRHGKPVILKIDAKQMTEDGCSFFLSDNLVWLTSSIPSRYITVYSNNIRDSGVD